MSTLNETSYSSSATSGYSIPVELDSINRDFHTWQRARVLDLSPVIVLDVLYMLFGVVGNSIVCYICMYRMPRSVINNFVLSLAILELLGCIFTIPVDITELLNAYAFDFPVLCKSEKYFRKVTIFSTGCILIAIAMERYKRIVKPHRRNMTFCQFRLAIIGAIVLSGVMAIPEAVFAGSETVQTVFGDGVICSTYHSDKYRFSIFSKLWGLVVIVIYIISIASIASIYILIVSTIWKREKVPTDRRSKSSTPDSTLQRRVRCHSFNESKSGELDTGWKPRNLLNCQHNSQQRCHSSCQAQVRKSDASYKSIDIPEIKLLEFQEKLFGLDSNKQDNHQSNPKADEQRLRLNYTDTDHCLGNDNTEFHSNNIQRIKLFEHKNNTAEQLQGYQDRLHRSVDINGELSHCNNNNDNYCRRKDNQQDLIQIKENEKKHQTDFFHAFLKTLNEKEHEVKLQGYNLYLHEKPQIVLRQLPIGSVTRKSRYSRKRTTFIMFVITMTSVVSHLPHMIAMVYSLIHPGVAGRLVADECVIFYIAWNSFFISLATHPFMYGFWNGRFKSALYDLFTGFKRVKDKTDRDSCSSGRHS